MTESDARVLQNGYEAAVLRAVSEIYPKIDVEILTVTLKIARASSIVLSAIERHFAELGITQGRFVILLLLSVEAEKSASPSRLADLCNVSRAAITGLLDGLEKSGFITRKMNADDRRSLIIELTAAGEDFLATAVRLDHFWLSERIGKIEKNERRNLIEAAEQITEIFKK